MKRLTSLFVLLAVPACAAPAFLQPAYRQTRPAGTAGFANPPAYGAVPAPQQVVQAQPQMRPTFAPTDGLDLGQAYRSESRVDSNGQLTLGAQGVPLRGWNGDVVDGRGAGASLGDENGARALEPSPSGRTYIIELYQQVLDERDALRQEVDALQQALEAAQGRIGTSADTVRVWESKVQALEGELKKLQDENTQLAERLTTAQIRRLEAEKTLLETQIRWRRESAERQEGGAQGN